MADNRHTLFGADGRYESVNGWPEPRLVGDRLEGPEGSLTWNGQAWIASAADREAAALPADEDALLASVMRKLLAHREGYTNWDDPGRAGASPWVTIDASGVPITPEELTAIHNAVEAIDP